MPLFDKVLNKVDQLAAERGIHTTMSGYPGQGYPGHGGYGGQPQYNQYQSPPPHHQYDIARTQ